MPPKGVVFSDVLYFTGNSVRLYQLEESCDFVFTIIGITVENESIAGGIFGDDLNAFTVVGALNLFKQNIKIELSADLKSSVNCCVITYMFSFQSAGRERREEENSRPACRLSVLIPLADLEENESAYDEQDKGYGYDSLERHITPPCSAASFCGLRSRCRRLRRRQRG